MKMKQVLVIGGGASGLVAAIACARGGASVTVLEARKKIGTKLLTTGNGRCNYTHTGEIGQAYRGKSAGFAREVLSNFSSDDTIAFFRDLGIYPLNRDNWVYPHSEQAASVLKALSEELSRLGVKIKTNEIVTEIRRDATSPHPFTVRTKTWHYEGDAVIACCGSPASLKESFPNLDLLTPFRLKSRPYHPALTYLTTSDKKAAAQWAGVRARAGAALYTEERRCDLIWQETGQIQFTARGISGIPIFNMSSLAGRELAFGHHPFVLMDLFPFGSERELLSFMNEVKSHAPKKTIQDLASGLLPDKLIPLVLPPSVTTTEAAAHAVKNFSVPVTGTGPLSASQVAGGGIDPTSLDPSNMMVRSVPGLYVTGEMLACDAVCGGWNLQLAWSTGYLAGKSAAKF